MNIQRVSLTEAVRRLKQIRQIAQEQGVVVLTSHDKPALIVIEVERGRQLLEGAEQLTRLITANNLLTVAHVISAADEWRLGVDVNWIKQVWADLRHEKPTS